MFPLNIPSIKTLSQRSGLPQDFLLGCKNITGMMRKKYFYDHKDSKKDVGKYIRVVQRDSYMQRFHKWLDEELKSRDCLLLPIVVGGISKKSTINAIAVHKRGIPFTFIKSDLSRFFESIPKGQIISLFSGRWKCGREVSETIANAISFPIGEVGIEGDLFLARGLNVSSRVAIWASIQFFQDFTIFVRKKYKKYKPRLSYYVDDIGISLITLDQNVIDEFMIDLKGFIESMGDKYPFLSLKEEKTSHHILRESNDFVEYLGSKIYIDKVDISDKTRGGNHAVYQQYQKAKSEEEKLPIRKKLSALKNYKTRLKTLKRNK